MCCLHMALQSFPGVNNFLTVGTMVGEGVREMLAFNMISHIAKRFVAEVQAKTACWHSSFIFDDQMVEVFWFCDVT